VSKLRENAKHVIGVGVKNSTSDLLIGNCDEFIYYDDLVREQEAKRRARRKHAAKPAVAAEEGAAVAAARKGDGTGRPSEGRAEGRSEAERRQEALDLVVETVQALAAERGEEGKVWGSMIKQTLKRRMPGFSESYYGFDSFGDLLQEAEARKLLLLERDEKSGGHVVRLPR